MQTSTSVAKGASSLYAANVLQLLFNTLYFLVLTNVLKSSFDVGIVTALNIMIWLLVTVSILAQPVTLQSPIPAPLAILRFVPNFIARRDRSGAKSVVQTSLLSAALVAGAVSVVLIIFPTITTPFLGGTLRTDYIRLSAIDVLVLSVGQVSIATLIGLGKAKQATLNIVMWSVVKYGAATIMLIFYSISGVLAGFIIGDAVLLLVTASQSFREFQGTRGTSHFSFSDLFRYSAYTLFSALVGFGITQADKIFTLARQGLPGLAIYNVAIVASSFAGFAPYALLTVLLPALSALYASRKRREMREVVQSYTRYVAVMVVPIAFGFASLMEIALRIFGQEYLGGLWPAVLVTIATGVTAISAVYASILLAIEELKWYTAANVLGLVMLVAVSALTTPLVGLTGPAMGRAALMGTTLIVYALAAKKRGFLRLDLKALAFAVIASSIMSLIVFALVSLITSFYLRILLLPFFIGVGLVIYLSCLRISRLLSSQDLEFLLGVIPKSFRPAAHSLAKASGFIDKGHSA